MNKQRIIIKEFTVNENLTVMPVFVDLPYNTISIDGLLITTSQDNLLKKAKLKGRIKITSNAFKKADLPDFDVFAHNNKKWNKDIIDIASKINDVNKQIKISYQPIIYGKPDITYSVKVYLKCTISDEC